LFSLTHVSLFYWDNRKAAAGQKKGSIRKKKNALTQNTKGKPNPNEQTRCYITLWLFLYIASFYYHIIIKHMVKGGSYNCLLLFVEERENNIQKKKRK